MGNRVWLWGEGGRRGGVISFASLKAVLAGARVLWPRVGWKEFVVVKGVALCGGVLLIGTFVAGCCLVLSADQPEPPAVVATEPVARMDEGEGAVRRALPYLAQQTGTWIEQKKCTSCHQVPQALWAMNSARALGFGVDERLAEWNRWSAAFVIGEAEKPEDKESEAGARHRADESYQMLLAGVAGDAEDNGGTRERLIGALRRGRGENGLWHAGGHLPGQRRPQQETDEVTTMWSMLTLRSMGGGVEFEERATIVAGSTSLEHLVLRYLLALSDKGGEDAAALRKELLSHQNEDGGWGWLLEDASDALATGQALYALSHMAPEHQRDAVERAREFLVRTQEDDGSWHVPSTLAKKEKQAYVISNDWGTAWAVIGLARTLDRDGTARDARDKGHTR